MASAALAPPRQINSDSPKAVWHRSRFNLPGDLADFPNTTALDCQFVIDLD